jgi:serine/threonine-protein kinase
MEYIQHHVASRPIDLNQRVPDKKFPEGLAQVIAKAVEKKPEDRHQSAGDFARALQVFVPGNRSLSDVIPPPTHSPLPPPTLSFTPSISGDKTLVDSKPPVRPPPTLGMMLGVAAACLALGVILAVVFMRLVLK